MLVRLAHGLHRQDADVQIVGATVAQQRQQPLVDDRVGAGGQVRAVLFDGRRRQDRYGAHRVDVGVFRRAVVHPVAAHQASLSLVWALRPISRSMPRPTRARCRARLSGVELSMR